MSPLAWLVLLLPQAASPQVITALDRNQIVVGEEAVVKVRVISSSPAPVQLIVPPLGGLEIVARSERTEVSYGGGPARVTTLELRLRGVRPGSWRVGPLEIRQGSEIAQGDPVVITVSSGAGGVATTLNPRVRRILERAPAPPAGGRVALTLILSSDSALAGEQVDVLTAAWFPRDLRLQLRRPPTLEPPQIDGVWNYPQPVPTGIAASRQIGGVWYDVFILHQVIFPLVPGTVRVNPATLHYSVPLAIQFFSQEERYTLSSADAAITVLSLPEAPRPTSFSGAIGHQLSLKRTVTPSAGRVGEPLSVEVTVKGEGNVALWPAPPVRWPPEVRAYSDQVDDQVESVTGRLGGAKTFRYLVVPDSSGTFILPAVHYTYFDLATRSYPTADLDATAIGVASGASGGLAKALPPPLMYGRSPPLAWRLLHADSWLVLILLLLPPVVAVARLGYRRWPRPVPVPAPPDDLARLSQAVAEVLTGLVGPAARSRAELQHALQLAGVPPALAQGVVEYQERLQAARFGPETAADHGAVVAGAQALLHKLDDWRTRVRGPAGHAVGIALLVLGALPLRPQVPAPEQLYEAGALREAALGFAARAREEPAVTAHWYNLGAAEFRRGEAGRALAAWATARRLAPRDRHVRQALALVPPAGPGSAARLWAAPVTPEEMGLLAVLAWVVGWAGLGAGRAPPGRWLVLIGAATLLGAGAGGVAVAYRQPVAVVIGESKLLVSPYGRAPVVAPLSQGSVVVLDQRRADWALARDEDGHRGWIPLAGVVPLGTDPEAERRE